MIEFASLLPITTAVIVALLVLGAFALIEVTTADRLVRCPQTGGVGMVRVDFLKATDHAQVHSCDLWPERRNCSQECLRRVSKKDNAYRAALKALRPL